MEQMYSYIHRRVKTGIKRPLVPSSTAIFFNLLFADFLGCYLHFWVFTPLCTPPLCPNLSPGSLINPKDDLRGTKGYVK